MDDAALHASPPARGGGFSLKSYEFRKEREAGWLELEELVSRVEKKGLGALTPEELYRLPSLYRSAISSLATARAISLDKNVVTYLESLSGRAFVVMYGVKRPLGRSARAFFSERLPALVYGVRKELGFAILLLALGTVTGFVMTQHDPARFYSFVSHGMAGGRSPSSTREELLRVLHDDGGGASGTLTHFATFLFTHNAKIGMLCFALGILAGVPTMLLLFTNGLTLGAMAALYAQHDLSFAFWSWVLPHGVTELYAVALSGAAGLAVARSLIDPGPHRRLDALAQSGRRAGAIMIGAVLMFFMAALIEGFFRQMVHDILPRAAMAAATAALWIAYFLRGRRLSRR